MDIFYGIIQAPGEMIRVENFSTFFKKYSVFYVTF